MTAVVTPELAATLRAQHMEKLGMYKAFLDDPSKPFFDVVVVTSADADQTATFEANIEHLQTVKRIPGKGQTDYMVVPDPPGRKVGCGGSTLYVIRDLQARYGEEYKTKRVLLIHAGGYSKRLPNHSHCGKIFSLLPASAPGSAQAALTMLELKLATFAHIPEQMPAGRGGVFVTCSDDIVFYDHKLCDFSKPGFIALGHPGSTSIGKDHGVFVLEDNKSGAAGLQPCKKFIHKYSIPQQIAEGAVVGKTAAGEDEVLTDSSYFFSQEVTEKLLEMFVTTLSGEVKAEVDAYGDFMQGIGSGATDEWMSDFGNTAKKDDAEEVANILALRKAFSEALKGMPLWCLALPGSRFYHVGTIKEALHHFAQDAGFLTCLGSLKSMDEAPAAVCKIETLVAADADVSGPSVIEFSRVPASAKVGSGCIVSGVELPEGAVVPANTFLQTLPIDTSKLGMEGACGYVTHVLSTQDDIKKQKEDVTLFGKSVSQHLKNKGSIWTSKMYPVRPTAAESLQCAFEIQAGLESGKAPAFWDGSERLVSLAECVMAKNLKVQAEQRKVILDELASA
eukprot:TRINITY_DN37_c0_g1_i1.p2 TRINITY_DN37_c0_g1~~TRINITY_DN37_c0_g1_i1.p2  ORF type:complete len:564 (+),score=334.12 TRINITY_DN37_c0_g1_i1:64-1755(+)